MRRYVTRAYSLVPPMGFHDFLTMGNGSLKIFRAIMHIYKALLHILALEPVRLKYSCTKNDRSARIIPKSIPSNMA